MAATGIPVAPPWSGFIAAHRASRRRHRDEGDRVLILARDPAMLRWIEHELFGERVTSTVVDSLSDVVATLTLRPPPWPRFLIVDTRELTSADIQTLDEIRAAGWPGVVIAVGDGSHDVHLSLGMDRTVPSFGSEVLRNELKRARKSFAR